MRRAGWITTKYPGVMRHPQMPGQYALRGKPKDRLGRTREFDRIVKAESAQAAAAMRLEMMVKVGGTDDPAVGRLTFGEYAKCWMTMYRRLPGRRAGTARNYENALVEHILPVIGHAPLATLRRTDVQCAVNELCAKTLIDRIGMERRDEAGQRLRYSPGTVQGWVKVLTLIIRAALNDGEIPPDRRDPSQGIEGPRRRDTAGVKRTPALAEVLALLNDAKEREPAVYPLWLIEAATGLRYAHASALQWSDIDWPAAEGACGAIRPVRARVSGGVDKVSKSKPVPSFVPMSPEVAAVLRDHYQRCMLAQSASFSAGWVFPRQHAKSRGPISYQQYHRAWLRCTKRCGVALAKGYGPHSFRRAVVDILGQEGVHPQTGMKITGHSSLEMFDLYRTVVAPEVEHASRLISTVLFGATGKSAR